MNRVLYLFFFFVLVSCSDSLYEMDLAEGDLSSSSSLIDLYSDSIVYRGPYPVIGSDSAGLRDSVTIIVHQSQHIAALVVDSARFDRWENCDLNYPDSDYSDNGFIAEFLEPIQKTFADNFDFVIFVNNIERRGSCGYRASFKNLKNSVSGIGKMPWSFRFAGFENNNFEGYIHIPQRNYVFNGPILHEIVHNWGNYILDAGVSGHWGSAGVGGYLGGWRDETLVEKESTEYCAETFPGVGVIARAGVANNSITYAPLELYLMGLLPADSVPVTLIPEPFYFTDTSRSCFYTEGFQELTIDSIINEHGLRIPSVNDSPKEFSILVLLVSREAPLEEEWAFVTHSVDSLIAREQVSENKQNFWSATEGRGSLKRPLIMSNIRK